MAGTVCARRWLRKSKGASAGVRIVLHANRPAAMFPSGEYAQASILTQEDEHMNSSLAFVNGVGSNTLLSAAEPEAPRTPATPGTAANRGKSKDERQAEEESEAKPASKPGGFPNDPDDPTNPNEVRERHLNKIKP